MVRPEGFEPPTPKFVAWYSIQMNYGRINTGMKNFKYINLDWEPASFKILKLMSEKPEIFNWQAWTNAPRAVYEIPEMHKMFKPLNLTISYIAFYCSMNEYKHNIHTDAGSNVRINFPIKNCNETETKFFVLKENKKPQVMVLPNKETFNSYNEEDVDYLDSYFLTQAVVIDSRVPHQVTCHTTNFPRIACTVAFKEDISNLLE